MEECFGVIKLTTFRSWIVVTLLAAFSAMAAIACGQAEAPTATPRPTTPPAAQPTATAAPSQTQPAATATPVPARGEVPSPQTEAGTIKMALVDVPPGVGLNRLQAPDSFHHTFSVAETLFLSDYTPSTKLIQPWLAKSWNVTPDLKKGTINLQQGVQFHKGFGEMTAEDVAWSVNDANAALTPTSIHGQAGDLAPVVGEFKAVDKYTIEFNFISFDSRWEVNLFGNAGQGVGVFSKKAYEEKGEDFSRDNVVATGPFEVIEWVRDSHAVTQAIPSHWRKTAQIKKVHQIEVPEASTRVAMMKTGEVDAADIVPKDRNSLLNQGFQFGGSGLAVQLGIFFSGNLWEEKHAVTGNPVSREGAYVHDLPYIGKPTDADDMEEARKVRWSMALAIDKEAINDTIIDGLGWPVHIEYVSTRNPNWQSKWEVPYDVNRAKQLLGETAFSKGFSTALYIGPEFGGGASFPGEIGDAVAGMWGAIGIQTEVLKYAYAAFRPTVVGRTNTIPWITSCDEGRDNMPWDWPKGLVMTTMTRGGFSCGFESPWIAEQFKKQAVEPDITKRIQMTNEWVDYMYHWMLAPGIVAVPAGIMWNPKSIKEWPMRTSVVASFNNMEEIVPAR